jgi:5-formyltetrahydrofolate cyclo-ligase
MQQPASTRQLLRSQLKQQRASLSNAQRSAAASLWAAQAKNWWRGQKIPTNNIIAAYVPLRDELNISPFTRWLCAQGYRLCLPTIRQQSRELIFRQWQPGDDMLPHPRYQIQEPLPHAPPCMPDLVLVPLLGFDLSGQRMGYGGGYYDATLQALRMQNSNLLAIGCAYALQQCEPLPTAPHDQPLDRVITEEQVHSFFK